MIDPMPAVREILGMPAEPRPKTEAEIATEVLRAVKDDVHPGHMGTGSYSHLMACLNHVGARYGVEL